MKKIMCLLFCVAFALVASPAFATLLDVYSVQNTGQSATVRFTTYNNNAPTGVYTEYTLNTSLGQLEAFCVEGVASGRGTYELLAVPGNLLSAAYAASNYWSGGTLGSKEDYQVAI